MRKVELLPTRALFSLTMMYSTSKFVGSVMVETGVAGLVYRFYHGRSKLELK